MRGFVLHTALATLAFNGILFAQGPGLGAADHVAGEVLIQFTANVTDGEIANAFERANLKLVRHTRTFAMERQGAIGLTRAQTGMPVEVAVEVLNRLPGIDFAEPNFIAEAQYEVNDPFYMDGSLWGMYGNDLPSAIGPAFTTNPYGAQAEKAWASGVVGSASVVVGIIDSGIQFDHPDLAANIWTNFDEIPGNGIDDDGNGYVDDMHGWNALGANGDIYDPGYDDHGTHVAGTIGAVGGNGIGVAGVNWNVSMVCGKFLGRDGTGPLIDAIEAIDYMIALKLQKGVNIVALNNSWHAGAHSQALSDAVNRAAQAGIVFVVAAGNAGSNNDLSPAYPSCYDTTPVAGYDAVISVAGIGSNGERGIFSSTKQSSYGALTVDLAAPGAGVISTLPGSTYGYKSGTSMATPHVTGAIALFASLNPSAKAHELKSRLLTTGTQSISSMAAITMSGGTLDIYSLLTAEPSLALPPSAPSNCVASSARRGTVNVAWSDRSNNEKAFVLERRVSTGSKWDIIRMLSANTTQISDTVSPKTTYVYRVRAINLAGSSSYSNDAFVKTK